MVATLETGDMCWIEVKGAWTAQYQYCPLDKWGNLVKHLTNPKASLVKDFAKVSRLTPPKAQQIGVLLVGFEVAGVPGFQIPEEQLNRVRQAGRVREDRWQEEVESWSAYHQEVIPGRTTEDFQVKCWFWHRRLT